MAGAIRINPHGAGQQTGSTFWVISSNKQFPYPGGNTADMQIVQQPAKPAANVYLAGPFTNKNSATNWVVKTINSMAGGSGGGGGLANPLGGAASAVSGAVGGWLSSLGGMIASGIESGIVFMLKDIWNVIQGPAFVSVGIIIGIITLIIFFKDDIVAIGSQVGMAAAAA